MHDDSKHIWRIAGLAVLGLGLLALGFYLWEDA